MIDYILSDGLDESAKKELGISGEVPDLTPPYMRPLWHPEDKE